MKNPFSDFFLAIAPCNAAEPTKPLAAGAVLANRFASDRLAFLHLDSPVWVLDWQGAGYV